MFGFVVQGHLTCNFNLIGNSADKKVCESLI